MNYPISLYRSLMAVSGILLAFVGPSALAAQVEISPSNPASIQDAINSAVADGVHKLTIPKGVYRMTPTNGFHLRLMNVHDLSIDATGATLMYADTRANGILLEGCDNVVFRGATLQYEKPTSTQGVIEGLDPEGTWYDIRFAKGYPSNFDDMAYFPERAFGYVFDPKTRRNKPGCQNLYGKLVERKGADLFRVTWTGKRGPKDMPVAVGDLVAFRGKGGTDIRLWNCSHITLSSLTLRNANGFCIHEAFGEGYDKFENITVTYGPTPPGATEPPLLSANADAFHSSTIRHGPIVENCLFEGMGDDGVAIHGRYVVAMESSGNTVTTLQTTNGNEFRVGDRIRWYDTQGQPRLDAKVTAVDPVAATYAPPQQTKRRHFDTAKYYRKLTLDKPIAASFDDLICNLDTLGSGYIARNNTIRFNRGRGLLLKAEDGLVENNTIEGSTMAGIILAPELWWNEGTFSRNITIRGNTIKGVGFADVGPWNLFAGAITITAAGPNGELIDAIGHESISITGNTLIENPAPNIQITSARNVTVSNNKFIRPFQAPSNKGASKGVDDNSLVWLSKVDGVTFDGNTVTAPGACGKPVVSASATAANITGAATGIK
ncbi:MAG TPA: right-handed parallel beta-helix repeat-containing protein [Capsulimonadaceae bacterium]|jgi:hypothetical protein